MILDLDEIVGRADAAIRTDYSRLEDLETLQVSLSMTSDAVDHCDPVALGVDLRRGCEDLSLLAWRARCAVVARQAAALSLVRWREDHQVRLSRILEAT